MLWDLRKDVGSDVVDRLVVEAIRLHDSDATFENAIDDLFEADENHFKGLYQESLRRALGDRGFPTPPPPTDIESPLSIHTSLEIWPNPTSEGVSVRIQNETVGRAHLQLIDMTGRSVASRNLGILQPGMQDFKMDDLRLAPGVYLVSVLVGEHRTIKKLIISHR